MRDRAVLLGWQGAGVCDRAGIENKERACAEVVDRERERWRDAKTTTDNTEMQIRGCYGTRE